MLEIQVTNNKEQSMNFKFNSKIAKLGQIFQVQKSDRHLERDIICIFLDNFGALVDKSI